LFDCVIVGSGPAGVFSAFQLRGRNVVLLDVGLQADPGNRLPPKNLYDMRRDGDDVFEQIIGSKFEGMHNIFNEYMSPKLKGPMMRYVTRMPEGETRPQSTTFDACSSYAKGGLASAWGAGVLRFSSRDLRGFPISSTALDGYYDALTRHIGITGQEDDLTPNFGSVEGLLPPLPLSPQGSAFLESYRKQRTKLRARGITVGRTRSAILSQEHRGRDAYPFIGQDFFQPNIPAIYSPAYTLDEMVRREELTYCPGRLVIGYKELPDRVQVTTRDLKSGSFETIEGRFLLLAAGAINTAKIVLQSNSDFKTRLPILDNAVSFTPFVRPDRIGVPSDLRAFPGGELVMVYEGDLFDEPVQSSVYGLMGTLRADLLFQMPLSVMGNVAAVKYLVPAITVLQTFYPDDPSPENVARLTPDGALAIEYSPKKLGVLERHLISALRGMGYLSASFLTQFPKAGASIHYAGALPMVAGTPKPYQTDSNCLLQGTRRVFLADAATFPRLPSKNLTFTIMANAMRVAQHVKELVN
jgi:choline dehydrogenase-like flavoprotein